MLFISYGFIAFFACLVALYYLFPKRAQWMLLLVANCFFYVFSGWENFIFIITTVVICFFVGRALEKMRTREDEYVALHKESMDKETRKAYRAKQKKKRFSLLCAALVLVLGMLAVVKYTAFAITNVNSVLSIFGADTLSVPSMLMPMGISFYIFQSSGYLIDVYRGKTFAQKNIAKFALFVSFFPQLVQGPISRHSDLAEQLYTPHRFDAKNVKFGLQRVLWGYFKKLVIADRMLVAVKSIINAPEDTGTYSFLLVIFYSIQIYADFTGGIDITIGIAETMGIRLTENFNRPFSSGSTKEFWNRWHITMGSWFTDYVFYPLSVTKPMMKLSKFSRKHFGNTVGKRVPVYLTTAVTWFLTGLWHGAAWNFIVWGMLNCLVILVSQELEPLYRRFRERFPRLTASYPYHCFAASRTFLLMGLIRTLDCYGDVGRAFSAWGSMFTSLDIGGIFLEKILDLGLEVKDYIIIALAILLVAVISKLSQKKDLREALLNKTWLSWALSGALLIVIILFGAYGIGYDASQFIYKQF